MYLRKRAKWIFQSVVLSATFLLAAPPAMGVDLPPWAPAQGDSGNGPMESQYGAAYAEKSLEYGIAQSTCNRDAVGALVSDMAGSQAGNGDGQLAAAMAGSIEGDMVGDGIGSHMDTIDQACTGQAVERAEDYQAVSWTNPDTGAHYNVAPTGIYQSNGQYCRGYVTRIIIGNEIDAMENRACRQADGKWRKVT